MGGGLVSLEKLLEGGGGREGDCNAGKTTARQGGTKAAIGQGTGSDGRHEGDQRLLFKVKEWKFLLMRQEA